MPKSASNFTKQAKNSDPLRKLGLILSEGWPSFVRESPSHADEGDLGGDKPPSPKRAMPYEFKGVQKNYEYEAIELPLTSPGLMLLRKLRDEAHRFALTFHRKVRTKRMTGSALEEIPGVGPRRRRMLLRTFGSIEAIRRASVDELASVPTMTKVLAQQLKDYLNDGMND